ncbi:selenocysteine insertion sequence-binding protein 2-like [Haliotis asinina]|uniref:selenocysteine insertion sequence-binding protein 2-like n=1 Tax=Haliotis asinina TaxID=109174 RepID=UPI0035320966
MTESSNVQSSSLSVDAPIFTPGSYGTTVGVASPTTDGQVGGVPLTEVPGYITSCFPFIQPDQGPRGNGKWGAPGGGRGRGTGRSFTGRGGKSRGRGIGNSSYPSQHWSTNVQGYMPPVQTMQGMTFDGGTATGLGDGLLPTPLFTPSFRQPGMNGYNNYGMYGISSIHPQIAAPSTWNNFPASHGNKVSSNLKTKQVDSRNYTSAQNHEKTWPPSSFVRCHDDSKSRSRPRTIICKDISVQTDFSDELAALTLSQRPNALYTVSHSWKRKEKKSSDSNIVSYTSDSEVDSDSGYSSPLHRRNVRSNGTDPVGPLLLPTQPEPEHGRNLFGRNHSTKSPHIGQQLTYATIAQQNPGTRRMLSYSDVAASQLIATCDNTNLPSQCLATVIPVNNESDVNEGVQKAEGGKRRRRRRNRKRKKKTQEDGGQSDGLSVTGRTFSSSNVSRTSDVTLHFEDDSEFPDLYPSNVESGQERDVDIISRQSSISYSQILKSSPSSHVSRCSSRQSDDFDLSREQTGDENTDNWQDSKQESKSARKRRKRRELANKAAEVELAEISLEQQMLKELSLKPKQGLTGSQEGSSGKSPKTSKQGGIISEPAVVQESKKDGRGGGKKSKQPIAFDIGAMITALEKKKEVNLEEDRKSPGRRKEEKLSKVSANILDSSAPAKRGKERENAKPKKPSPLKKVILKEREQKKKMRLLDDDNDPSGLHIAEPPVGIGVVNAESDLSQDGLSSKSSMELGNGASTSADLSPISQTSPISMSPLSPGTSPLSSGVNSPITGGHSKDLKAMMKIHSRRFREYCNQVLDKDIDMCCTEFLQDLVRFQDRMFHKDPVKAKMRRRLVLGLREVTKHLKLKKIKCVIISPNLEKIQSKGGLDDALNNILNMCQDQNIPFVFALGRRALGRACAKLVPVSCAGVFNYDGCEETFNKLMDYTEKARQAYNEMVLCIEKEMEDNPQRGTTHIYAHMGHSRTPSGCSVMSFTSSILSEPISENYPHSEPETDSKGYEIVKDVPQSSYLIVENGLHPEVKVAPSFPSSVDEIDDGNEADTEDCSDVPIKLPNEKNSLQDDRMAGESEVENEVEAPGESEDEEEEDFSESDDTASSQHASDTVEELPHIDSIHTGNFDLSAEILSQHSGRTLDRSEVMSTHSSRTIGDGSSTIMTDLIGMDRTKSDVTKPCESPVPGQTRMKLSDNDRIQSWVDASNTNLSGVDENSDIDTVHSGSVTESENESESQGYVKGQPLKPISESGEGDL